jgi:hypothetical protein
VVVRITHSTARAVSRAWTPGWNRWAGVRDVEDPDPDPAGMVPGGFPAGEPSGPPVAAAAAAATGLACKKSGLVVLAVRRKGSIMEGLRGEWRACPASTSGSATAVSL